MVDGVVSRVLVGLEQLRVDARVEQRDRRLALARALDGRRLALDGTGSLLAGYVRRTLRTRAPREFRRPMSWVRTVAAKPSNTRV